MKIMFHQSNVSPHVAPLAECLARMGHRIVFVAYGRISDERRGLGWVEEAPKGCDYHQVSSKRDLAGLLCHDLASFEHICQGVRRNGLISATQEGLQRRGTGFFVASETVDLPPRLGFLKRRIYGKRVGGFGPACKGILAIGHRAPDFFAGLGYSRQKIYDFAYFVRDQAGGLVVREAPARPFRFVFVGQLIERKGVDLLLRAFRQLPADCHLDIVGTGPKHEDLVRLSGQLGLRTLRFHGSLPMDAARAFMAGADCLVLPSRFDGWGAVVSESILCGTPVICSDACGIAGVVGHVGGCAVFAAGDAEALGAAMRAVAARAATAGDRAGLAAWGQGLSAQAGARYLARIIDHSNGVGARPCPPWVVSRGCGGAVP